VSSSLIIQTSFLGDAVLTTPLVAELATRGPVDVVTTPAVAPLLANNPSIRSVIVYDKRDADAGALGIWRLARRLRAARYGVAYLAQGSHRSGALAAFAGIPVRVGFDTSAGRAWYTERRRHRSDRHHAERLWRLAAGDAAVSPDAEELRPRLYPGIPDRAAVDTLLQPVPRDGSTLVALAPGSIWGTKRWPHFPALAARLAPLHRVVIVGSSDDAPHAAAAAAAAGAERVVDATGRLSLLASAELIGRCTALVTNDSAPLHLASAMGTPTVAIFGPTAPAFGFGPLAPRHETVERALSCRPCHPHGPATCPLGHWRCMRELEVERVMEAVLRVTGIGPRQATSPQVPPALP
jgi:heptosyltransferase-2